MMHRQKYSKNIKKLSPLLQLRKNLIPTYVKREMAKSVMKNLTKEFLKFGDVKMEKFVYSKKAINKNNVVVEKILVSDEFANCKNKETNGK